MTGAATAMSDEPAPLQSPAPQSASGKNVLYITLDGITDPLGRSQVLPYLMGLSRLGHRFTLLSAEKEQAFGRYEARVREMTAQAGIRWVPIPYRQTPPILSKVWNAQALKREAHRLQRETRFDLVHCRSYIGAAAGLSLWRKEGVPFLFDMRGFFPDERVDGGSWPQSNPLFRLMYRHFKKLEGDLLREAAHVISLTREGKNELSRMTGGRLGDSDVTIIPCCVDFTHFPLVTARDRAKARETLGIPADAHVIGYLGSIGGWYMLDEMLDFFSVYRERHPDAVFLFVTPNAPDTILPKATEHGIDQANIVIRAASREEVPEFMAAADVGLFFIRPCFSKKASSPTKMAELIALGLPIVTNGGVGDVSEIVEQTGCGVAIDEFSSEAYREAITRLELLPKEPEKVRARAQPMFDVELGVSRYDACYDRICRQVGA